VRYVKKKDGGPREHWISPEAKERQALDITVRHARRRAKIEGVPCTITREYLEELYPRDGLCPIFQTPMVRGHEDGRDNSPSLDRRVPALGYVPGNLAFISNRANQLKGSMTIEQLERLLVHMKKALQ
jgi:hypothetical protein